MREIDVNEWGEDLLLPPTFVHPRAGQYKDQPESFFRGKAVRLYVDIEVGSMPRRTAVWLDFVRFEDHVIDGTPMRIGLGKTQARVLADTPVAEGIELSFHVDEVFDVIERANASMEEPGWFGGTVAVAPAA